MGEKFRQIRLDRGMTATYVCRMTGIKQSRLSKIELGRAEISGKELLKLCVFFDIDCRTIA